MIVADTGAVLALLDKSDAHHARVRELFAADPDAWLLPWAILPEIDYLVARELGASAERLWLEDLAAGAYAVEWGTAADLEAAQEISSRYRQLELGLVDCVVLAIAERLRADIATLDLRDFGSVRLSHNPRLLPRDAVAPPARGPAPRRPRRA